MFQNGQCPKSEREDPEIEKVAEQIREGNAKKMVQLQQPVVIQKIQQNSDSLKQQEVEKSLDWNSVQGHFGWMEIGKELIPYIIRGDVKYVADRMTKVKLLFDYKMLFTDEIFEYLPIKMVYATSAEARLLTEINGKHCDKFYGLDNFTEKDYIFPLADAIEGYHYLNFCHKKLTEMNCSEDQRCGFIKINKSSLVPYVLVKDNKFVPLFYFEGDCEHLEKYAIELKGWDLAYLKFVCKIQGIRRTLYDNEVITVVELEYLKKFFLPGTDFETSWDIQNFNKNDLLRPATVINTMITQYSNVNQSKEVRNPNHIKPSSTYYPPYQKHHQRHRGGHSTPSSNVNPQPTQQQQRVSYTQAQRVSQTQSQLVSQTQQQPPQMYMQHQRALQPQQGVLQQQQRGMQQAPHRAPAPNQQRISQSNQQRVPHQQRVYQRQQQVPQAYSSNISQANAMMQNNCSNFYQIPEVENRNPLQYFLSTQEIDGKALVGCINSEPFNPNSMLVTLEEIARSLFQLNIILVKNAINAMRLDIFLPNTEQINILRSVNLTGTDGLIKVKSLYENLAQIKYILGFK